ncbi:Selenocysteine-specific elongation factor [Sciurus carolinensis]|uniref:Selenocysteine-specific elongation factor n=1 Tax=Sciurus carolinensis TaxID=30640 RepID=A0AA41SZH3_SCICA|nr:Selenocysteine-specific elongation factor [Sciurus carolinensis]
MAGRRVNVNVGVLGHIDSGKTALARALSTTASTAAFDKQPQSRERGITLDLGFSCFSVPPAAPGEPLLQVTLVDCPGHASLIRTIIGGAQIIDLMMLVIDVTKGMQTQSAECLVIGQIACQKLVVVLNKIDLLAEGKRQAAIDKMTKKMQKTLENTKFRGAPIIPVAAKPGGPEAPETEAPQGITELIQLLKSQISIPERDPSGPFLMSVDHCFSIKGQGTVMTGTILSGSISLGDSVEIPALKREAYSRELARLIMEPAKSKICWVVKKVKSMQMFHTPVASAAQGDRLGVCVTQFDPKLLERGLVCAPGSLHTLHAALVSVEKIPYFRGPLQTKAKLHITVGHDTVMGRLLFFSPEPERFEQPPQLDAFDFSREYLLQDQLLGPDGADGRCPRQQWALVEFEKPITCPRLCLVIGSRLDADIHANTCRLAFHGRLLCGLVDRNYAESVLPALRVYKLKHRHGLVERAMDDHNVIGRSLFKKETNIQLFVGLKVQLSTGELGVIDSAFGQSGKFKVHVPGKCPSVRLREAWHVSGQLGLAVMRAEAASVPVPFPVPPAADAGFREHAGPGREHFERLLALGHVVVTFTVTVTGVLGGHGDRLEHFERLLALGHVVVTFTVTVTGVLGGHGDRLVLLRGAGRESPREGPPRTGPPVATQPGDRGHLVLLAAAGHHAVPGDTGPEGGRTRRQEEDARGAGGLSPESKRILAPALKKRGRGRGEAARQEEGTERPEPPQHVTLSLSFKRYVFDTHKRMVQSP